MRKRSYYLGWAGRIEAVLVGGTLLILVAYIFTLVYFLAWCLMGGLE